MGGQNGSGGKLFWEVFCIGDHFISGGFRPRWFFDGWLMTRGLLSESFLLEAFDRISNNTTEQEENSRKTLRNNNTFVLKGEEILKQN